MKIFKKYIQFWAYRQMNFIPLLKDPIALLSVEWLANNFDIKIVILVRHPAAFVSSIKRLKWSHPFSHFIKQPLLIRDHIYPFEDEIYKFARKEQDIIDQACLLWRILNFVVNKYKKIHQEWVFLKYEDIAISPITEFSLLSKKLNLLYSDKTKSKIIEHSIAPNQIQKTYPNINLPRINSKNNIWSWKNNLDNQELLHIRNQVEDISHHFYNDADWESPY